MGGSSTTNTTQQQTRTTLPREIRARGTRITNAAMRSQFDPAKRYEDFSYNADQQASGRARTAQLNDYHTQAGQASQTAQNGYQPHYAQAGAAANQAATNVATGPNYSAQTIDRFMDPYAQHVIDRGVGQIGRNLTLQRLDNQSRAAQAGAFGGARHGVVDAESQRTGAETLQNFIGDELSRGFGQAVDQYNTDFSQQNAAAAQNYAQGMGLGAFQQGLGTATQQAALNAQASANQQGNITMAQDQAQRDAARAAQDQERDYALGVYERLAALNAGQPVNRTSTTSGTSTQEQSGGWLGPVLNAAGTIGGAALSASDERVKKDIKDIDPESVLGAFAKIKPKTYRYKDDVLRDHPDLTKPGKRTGFMAQDVEKAFGTKMKEVGGFKTIDLSEEIGKLVVAVHGLEKRTRSMAHGRR